MPYSLESSAALVNLPNTKGADLNDGPLPVLMYPQASNTCITEHEIAGIHTGEKKTKHR